MPLVSLGSLPVKEIFPGLRARLVHTDRVTHSWVEVDEGASFPEHQHPHEQITHMLRGRLRLTVAGVPHELVAGQSLCIPGATLHSADTLEDALVIDTFSPPREDLLAQDRAEQ